jgi:cytochrome c oxidase subunit 2
VFPGRETRLWFKADSTGLYPGQCAEFCGIQHARMAFHVRARSPEEFDTWLARMQTLGAPAPAPAPGAAAPAADSLRTASAGATLRQQGGAAVDSASAPADPLFAKGEQLFKAKGCIGCHSLQAKGAPTGLIGPNLANVGARGYLAAGWLKNTDENLEKWIQNPQALKKGVLMPNLGVTAEEAQALRAYLRAHN